ncbi:MAG: secretin and TonB N-terminal domain-containing protein [Candidatus Omnitrophica bacterium]|nr:secretin and TonB N-terminal domain-containing protein [Candidatus Omnitrophota bacterium]
MSGIRRLRFLIFAVGIGWFGAALLSAEETVPEVSGAQETQEPIQVAQLAASGLSQTSLLSLDFREADLLTVLQALARKAKINIVTSSDVAGTVTIHLEDVTWEQALDTIVQTAGLAYEKQDNVILVTTLDGMKTRREALKELVDIEPVITKVMELKYLDANDVQAFLEPQLTGQGKISVLEMTGQKGWSFGAAEGGGGSSEEEKERTEREKSRSKAIVVTDTPTTIDRLEKILTRLDVMPRQILIEARVMEVNRDLLRDLGLEIGTGSSSTSISSTSGFVSSTTSRSFSQQTLDEVQGADHATFGGSVLNQFLSPSTFVPKTTGLTAANTGLNLLLRHLGGTQMELLIRALEEDARTNTLSAPNILTLSGQEARILIGERFPILNTQVSGTDTTTTTTTLEYYQNIGIELYVVPQVSGDRHIDMIIHPVVSARTGTVGTNQYPILDVREAETQVILEHGETIVIGGLLKDIKSKSRIGIPFLGKLPVVGALFSRHTTDASKVDLLIFINAKVIDPGSLGPEEVQRLQQQYEDFFHDQVQTRKKKSRSNPSPSKPEAIPAQRNFSSRDQRF